jgi:hypothetical protein
MGDHQPRIDVRRPRLTRAEYWLLETAIEAAIPLMFLEAEGYSQNSSIEQMFNKPGHGIDRPEMIECLEGLLAEGLIEGWIGSEQRTFVPTKNEISAALSEWRAPRERLRAPSPLAYRLTQKGGLVWEAFAAPCWEHLVAEQFGYDPQIGTLTCLSLCRLERFLEYRRPIRMEEVIDFDSVRFFECGEWEATYWKRFPQGHCASFEWTEAPDVEQTVDERERAAFGDYCEFREGWYRWR